MRKEGIVLENHVELPPVRRKVRNIFAVKNNPAFIRHLKAAEDSQRSCFSAARRPEERYEFIFMDNKVKVIKNKLITK